MSKESNTQWLVEMGAKFEAKNNGEHLIIETKHGYVDFWPSTAKWAFRVDAQKGQGVESLVQSMRDRNKPVAPVEEKPDFESLLLEAYALRSHWPEDFTQRVMKALGKGEVVPQNSNTKMPWD